MTSPRPARQSSARDIEDDMNYELIEQKLVEEGKEIEVKDNEYLNEEASG